MLDEITIDGGLIKCQKKVVVTRRIHIDCSGTL